MENHMPPTQLLDDKTFRRRSIRAYQRACATTMEVFQDVTLTIALDDDVLALCNETNVIALYKARKTENGQVRISRLPLEAARTYSEVA
jgi:hypothetical protein